MVMGLGASTTLDRIDFSSNYTIGNVLVDKVKEKQMIIQTPNSSFMLDDVQGFYIEKLWKHCN